VVVSHYQVNLDAVSTGYIVPVGVDNEVAMDRADALVAPAADILVEDFTDFLFPDAPPFEPCMFLVLTFEPRGYVMNNCLFKTL
jgi:hypothetical protein